MKSHLMKKRMDVAAGRIPADYVIKNGKSLMYSMGKFILATLLYLDWLYCRYWELRGNL